MAGRDHQRLGHRRVAPGAHQQLEHIVQRRGVGAAGLHDRLHVVQELVQASAARRVSWLFIQLMLPATRVDFAVMRQHAERLRQPPGREGVGGIALVVDGEARDEALVQQVRVEIRQAARPGTCPYR